MNFSNYRHIRVLCLIFALTLCCTLFAGCQKEPETTEPSETLGLNLNLPEATDPIEESTEAATDPTEVNENMATVTSRINVRSNPASDAAIIYTLEAGDRIEITRRSHVVGFDWGYTPTVPGGGWVIMDFVEMDVKTEEPDDNSTPAAGTTPTDPPANNNTSTNVNIKGVVTVNGLNIRSKAGTDGNIVGSYDKGDVVTITQTSNGWGKTDKGWIKMEYVNTTNTGTTGGNNNGSNNNNNGSTTNGSISGNGSTTVVAKGIVKAGELNLRSKASTEGEKLGTLKYGARVEILEKSGSWGRTSKGWVHMDYIYQDGTTGKNTAQGVTTSGLHIRSGPGTTYASIGSYAEGETVKILEQFTYGNTAWGCTSKGWICMDYVDVKGGTTGNTGNLVGKTGVVVTGELNVRSEAGSQYEIVDSFKYGDKVTILEVKNGWGRTNKGWISLNFVEFDEDDFDGDSDDDTTGTVTATELRIREDAGTQYDIVGTYEYGDRITILQIKNGWGRTNKGWVSLDHVDLD